MLQNIFSHRPPLYDVFNKAELYALHVPCNGVTPALFWKISYTNSTLTSPKGKDSPFAFIILTNIDKGAFPNSLSLEERKKDLF